ncbi:hypothetical protein CK489_29065 [Bradyrhizobium sp. UFLA03-84]|uniref:DUF3800 domain-containing protein n=1 Tax=Bradyrhizobium sp. UFLA03-84 TaxID=418599 RepID=UPI000BAE2500|nr:DUF3800 domain-containing protein [Bradyrhizobium sp. UFLA03-84]PAY05436.1 hypothetical protein CK489_29065 [Bradyrhizobium sp. UFLA03-84]
MTDRIAIYCDESCHLQHDGFDVMVVGCIWTPREAVARLSAELLEIKIRHTAAGELKWTKVSASRQGFYEEVVHWFFNSPDLHFRAVVIANKKSLDHDAFNSGSHDDFYYKMKFSLLSKILSPTNEYEIYLDIKDTRSRFKIKTLREILLNNRYDFTGDMIDRVQHVRSHEVEMMQLADLLIGAVAYRHRNLSSNPTKAKIVSLIEERAERPLTRSTALTAQKFNLFVWTPRQVQGRVNR